MPHLQVCNSTRGVGQSLGGRGLYDLLPPSLEMFFGVSEFLGGYAVAHLRV